MSVLIKMPMPKNCNECPMQFYEGQGICSCRVLSAIEDDEVLKPWKKKRKDCPLIEVKPHGRLIDADALLERFEKEEKAADEHGRDFSFSFKSGGENCTEWWPVQQMLMDAPTIIEAEVEHD